MSKEELYGVDCLRGPSAAGVSPCRHLGLADVATGEWTDGVFTSVSAQLFCQRGTHIFALFRSYGVLLQTPEVRCREARWHNVCDFITHRKCD